MSTPAPLPDRADATDSPDSGTIAGPAPARTTPPHPRSRIWLWIVALVVLQLTAWIAWLTIASKHRVAEVPLAPAAGDKP